MDTVWSELHLSLERIFSPQFADALNNLIDVLPQSLSYFCRQRSFFRRRNVGVNILHHLVPQNMHLLNKVGVLRNLHNPLHWITHAGCVWHKIATVYRTHNWRMLYSYTILFALSFQLL